ncbi:hypothetical protein FSP39_008470 [Pinctada imbricata]|uniref:UBZ4-type domain-containing protein n=1 Tax=Pinctada imbricata TaxID=66713 RepID=A0AA88XZR1_PINIB|nr:hypothetical protein FSP39_008470 [Pinctada imbricata]
MNQQVVGSNLTITDHCNSIVTLGKLLYATLHSFHPGVNRDKERVDSPASPIKPLCRHYRKSLRKEGCIRTLYSPSIDSVSTYTKAIIQYFEIYHRRLTQLQAKSKCMIEWGQSVKVGKHWDTTIDAKRRGQEVFDLEDSDEEKGNGQDDKALRTNKDQNGKDMSAAIQIDEDDDFDNYVPLRQTRRNKARGRGQGQMNENDKNEEIARVLNARGKSGKRITHAISLSDSEDDLNEKNNKSKKVSKQLPRNQRKDEIVLDENNQFDACDDEIPSQMQEKVSEKPTLSSFKNSESLQMNFSKTDRKSQSKYTFKKTSAGIDDRSSKFNKQKESSPESDGGDKLSDKGIGNEKKCRVVLQRHKSDLSTKSTGSFRSDDLDLECLEEDNVMDKGIDKQGILINEESTDRLSQSSSALLNSQGDLYSTQYCVRKERSLKVASVRPVLRWSSPEFTGDEATCSGSQKEGKQIDRSNHQIMEDDHSDDGISAAQGNQRNLEPNVSSDDLNDDDGKFVPQDDEENIDIYNSSSESEKENRKGAKRKKFSTERKLQNRKPNVTKVSERVKDSSSEEDMETGVEKSVNEQQEPSFDLPIGHKGGLNGSQEAASSTSKFHDGGMSKLYLSRSPTPEQQFNLDNPKASSSRSEVVDLDIDSSSSDDEIVVRRGSRKRVKTYSKKGKDEQVPPKVKVQEEEKVPCPMCFKPFSVAEIQEHAENCEGETGDVEEDLAVIEETTPISGATRRGTSRGNVREVPTGGGDNRETNSPTPAPRGTQKCFLCDKRIAKAKYDAHVDLCLKEATKRQEMADTKGYDQVLDVDDEPELEPAQPRKTRQRVGDRRNQTDRQPRNHTENKQGQQLNFDGKPTFSWNLPSDNNEDSEGSSSTSSYNLVYYSSSSNSPTKTPVKSSHNTLPGGWTAEELDNSPIRTFVPIWRQKDSEGFTGQFDNLKKKYERQLVKKKLSGKRLTGKRKKPGRRKKRKVQGRGKKSGQK